MGSFGDAFKKGVIDGMMSYSGRFRYHVEFGKGLVVSRMGIKVYEFDGSSGGKSPLNLYSGKDNSVVIALEQARQSKTLSLYVPAPSGLSTDISWAEFNDTLHELYRIRELGKPFFLSFAVQKNSNGKKIEMLLLQDNATSFKDVDTNPDRQIGRIRYDFTLKSPVVKPASVDR